MRFECNRGAEADSIMRKSVLLFLFIFLIVFSGCSESTSWNPDTMEKGLSEAEISTDKIAAAIKETDMESDSKSITILFENKTNSDFIYGQEPRLEVRIDTEWYVVPIKDGIAWTAIAIQLKPNSTNEYEEDLGLLYDNLIAGHYRYIKSFSGYSEEDPAPGLSGTSVTVCVEFDIDQNNTD